MIAPVTVSLTLDASRAILGVRVASFLSPLIGVPRAIRLAEWSANRLVRYRIGKGRWRHIDPGVSISQTTEAEVTELAPVDGPIAKCPECDSELLGTYTIEHNADGSHTVIPSPEDKEAARKVLDDPTLTPIENDPRDTATGDLSDPAQKEEEKDA